MKIDEGEIIQVTKNLSIEYSHGQFIFKVDENADDLLYDMFEVLFTDNGIVWC
jgi:hypothetical protein